MRAGFKTYLPMKSLCGVASLISNFTGALEVARIVNIPASTLSGRKFPASI